MKRPAIFLLLLGCATTAAASPVDYNQYGVNMSWFGFGGPPAFVTRGQQIAYDIGAIIDPAIGTGTVDVGIPNEEFAEPPVFAVTEVAHPNPNTRHFKSVDNEFIVFWQGHSDISGVHDVTSFEEDVAIVGIHWCQPLTDTAGLCSGGGFNASNALLYGVTVNNGSAASVPEPGALSLVALGGLVGLVSLRRKGKARNGAAA